MSESDLPADSPQPCRHERVEWFEDLRWYYESDPRLAASKIKRMEVLAVVRRRCLDCGAVERKAGTS